MSISIKDNARFQVPVFLAPGTWNLAPGNEPAHTMNPDFDSAVTRSRELKSRPSNEDLLLLYALYKQATEGDVSGERPGGFDFKAIAKYDAWAEVRGKSREDAMKEYVELVERLERE